MPDSQRRAALALLAGSLLFSTGGAAIKSAQFTGWQIASLRSGIAGMTLLLLVPAARRGWGWRPLLVGAAYAILARALLAEPVESGGMRPPKSPGIEGKALTETLAPQ